MCGIYGLADQHNPIDIVYLKKQRDILAHRGPDDAGVWISASSGVGIAHRRLSIIDISQAGHQPLISIDGRYAIVFNGEIYNFQALRKTLEMEGHLFVSKSDTEVVLVAYQEWGDQCLNHFNGMFAFAIYDAGTTTTPPSFFFARDRAGKKPFYYFHEGHRFQFASELKAIDARTSLDLKALNYYMALGYVPGEMCLAKNIFKLPPAHAARLDLATFKFKVWRYWQLPKNNANPYAIGEELTDRAEELLLDAVRLRMISDVPLGVLLSGGLDSSLIVAAAARQSSMPVKTFTIAMPGSKLDESAYAKCVGDYFGTEHHVLEALNPSMAIIIDELAHYVDEPIADSSMIPTFLVSRLTRQHVTVALGGDGGDELFGGYSDYPKSLADQERLWWAPPFLLMSVGKLAANLPAGVRGRNLLVSLRGGGLQQMIWGSPYFDTALRRRVLTGDVLNRLGEDLDAPERWLLNLFMEGVDPVDSMTRTHFGSILPDDFLAKVDRASMAFSLEIRSPFLDYRMVEFAFSNIPSVWKVSGNMTRRIQGILAQRMLPPNFVTNRKQGFSIPLDEWLRVDKCNIIKEWLSFLPEAISRSEIRKLIVGHMNGRANGSRLFGLLMLAIACKNNKF